MASPHLPAASLAANRASLVEFSDKRDDRILDSIDDSSSVTSMSSSSKALKCYTCRGPEVEPTLLFVRCVRCQRRWHHYCHQPRVTDRSTEFTCKRCTDKIAAKHASTAAERTSRQPASSSLISHSHSAPYVSIYQSAQTSATTANPLTSSAIASSSVQMPKQPETKKFQAARICQADGCTVPIFSMKLFCGRHEAENRYKDVRAKPPVTNTPFAPRPFQKSKMHNVRPEDKPFLKRKRSSIAKEPISSPSTSATSPYRRKSITPRQQPQGATLQPAFTKARLNHEEQNRSLDFDSLDEPMMGADSSGSNTSPARPSPELGSYSPEYEPPPPQVLDTVQWTTHDDADSPGSQIAQELQATADQSIAMESNAINPSSRLSPLPEYRSPTLSNAINDRLPSHPGTRQDDMLHANGSALIDRMSQENQPSPAKTQMPLLSSPSPESESQLRSPSLSPAIFPQNPKIHIPEADLNMDIDTPGEAEELYNLNFGSSGTLKISSEFEAAQKERRRAFDESSLDAYLDQQRKSQEFEPTAQEILDSQVWGSFDPRSAWPQRMADEEADDIEKRKEWIAAHPNRRKQNFGKLLTDKVKQRRALSYWDANQQGERREDGNEFLERMEEFFGIDGLEDLVPSLKNGRLVMVERETEDDEPRGPRRRGRVEPKVYPIALIPS